MILSKIIIENYKCFNGKFSLEFNEKINILVGDNEAGKSTIIESIFLGLTGYLHGKPIKSNISSYLFNNKIVEEYIESINTPNAKNLNPPHLLIELYFTQPEPIDHNLQGNDNTDKSDCCGVYLKVEFDETYAIEYEALIKSGKLISMPVEYYKVTWSSFAREYITARSISLKPALIDSSTYRLKNGSDMFINQIVSNLLDEKDKISITQEHRKFQDTFGTNESVKSINEKIKNAINIENKNIKISSDLSSHNAWQTFMMTYLNEIPFHHTSKGEQGIMKAELALASGKSQKSNLILAEELENHLSHSTLSQLLFQIENKTSDKQLIISTHNNFVANKLGLNNLIFLAKQKTCTLKELTSETYDFFKKLAGYNTLRLLLCKVAVLVEGPSDELIFQKAYQKIHGCLPIHHGIDILSVGLASKRFLEIAKLLNIKAIVITDNDGDFDVNITKKYIDYSSDKNIKISADERDEFRTLEYQFVDANKNNLDILKSALQKKDNIIREELEKYMLSNKTDWALDVFSFENDELNFPEYIQEAVEWCYAQK